ncbi:uncharacterized protein LOC117643948 [Thrips palmi]|uniref:Uncharacterized protein LOC117643948 n=1 Tax=Thrips palmi TaxID=161013 RepID=A0A6P8YQ35_THRPL|nr:uncharacterized protein LOC117643948 [Thrips palmi]
MLLSARTMFSTAERLKERTGKKGLPRFEYLQELVTEFQDTTSTEAKQQVLANLANFAYDPINYDFLRNLKVIDLFLDQLAESDSILQQYAICGLCNLCLDPQNKEYIIHNGGVQAIAICLSSANEQTVLSAITTLMFLIAPESKDLITAVEIVECMVRLSRSANPRLRNLATVFLEDHCTPAQVTAIRKQVETASIPVTVLEAAVMTWARWRGPAARLCRLQRLQHTQPRPRASLKPGEKATLVRRITEADVRVFGALCGDANPVHSTGVPSGPADGGASRVLVHGALLNALASGVIGSQLPGPGSIVVGQNLRFPRPCLVGEEVTVVVEVKEVRKIVEVAFRCIVDAASDQPKVVMEGNAKLIMAELAGPSASGEGG